MARASDYSKFKQYLDYFARIKLGENPEDNNNFRKKRRVILKDMLEYDEATRNLIREEFFARYGESDLSDEKAISNAGRTDESFPGLAGANDPNGLFENFEQQVDFQKKHSVLLMIRIFDSDEATRGEILKLAISKNKKPANQT